MSTKRHVAVLGLVAAAALSLSACDSSSGGGAPQAENVSCQGKDNLRASGSTAQQNAMTRFIASYQGACSGKTVNYTGNGSGAGVNEFVGGQTDFAGSDSALDPTKGETAKAQQRCGGAPAWNLPTVFGPIAITYNLQGVTDLVLDGPTAAKIFNGTVKTWNDPAIAALNPGKALPAIPVVVVFRSDESGTTDNFQKYLTAASNGAWGKGTGKTFTGGVGEGAKGNDGTSAAIKGTPGAITYNEWSFAKQQNLPTASIVNAGGGQAVQLTADTAGNAVNGAQVKGQGNDLVLDLNSIYATKSPNAYPIMLATYEIVCSKYPDPATGQAVKAFLGVAAGAGQQGLGDVGYVPLPQQFGQRLNAAINAIG